jgi:uridine kinase
VIEAYRELAADVLGRPALLGATRLVAVDGPSGAGKTMFANRLANAFDWRVPIVRTDDFLDGWADQVTFWPRLEEWVLGPLRRGDPGRYRRYDWQAQRFGDEWFTVPPEPVVLLEGVTAARAEIRPELTLSVFVTAPAELCLARALWRDGPELRAYLEEWQRGEQRHFGVDATAQLVDLVVDGAPAVPHDPTTHFVPSRGDATIGE